MNVFTCVIIAMMIAGVVCPPPTHPVPHSMERRHKRDVDNTCVLSDEVDICPKNMKCEVDENDHPVCHVPGTPLPNSQCLPENEYEPYYVDTSDISGHEDCNAFDMHCPDKKICCRTRHGHHCFYKHKATSLRDDAVYINVEDK